MTNTTPGARGLILDEPLLWEKEKKGRIGFSLPRRDVESFPIDESLLGDVPDIPELKSQFERCASLLLPVGQ